PYVPKGYSKLWDEDGPVWNAKYNGKRVYIITNGKTDKGWYNGKWVKLYCTEKDLSEGAGTWVRIDFYRDKNHKKRYYSYDYSP
ncbi:MAG: hypothetical protein K5869_06140, partial [Saccharofermentans sp.]|nr:hypothetical protein [Saccharofermentans sp.]